MPDQDDLQIPTIPVTARNAAQTKPATLTGSAGVLVTFILGGLRVFGVWEPTELQLEWMLGIPGALGVLMLIAAQFGLISKARVDRLVADELSDGH